VGRLACNSIYILENFTQGKFSKSGTARLRFQLYIIPTQPSTASRRISRKGNSQEWDGSLEISTAYYSHSTFNCISENFTQGKFSKSGTARLRFQLHITPTRLRQFSENGYRIGTDHSAMLVYVIIKRTGTQLAEMLPCSISLLIQRKIITATRRFRIGCTFSLVF